eukprot:gene13821-biopygen16699
MSRGGCSRAES